jgi:hypothetical protein
MPSYRQGGLFRRGATAAADTASSGRARAAGAALASSADDAARLPFSQRTAAYWGKGGKGRKYGKIGVAGLGAYGLARLAGFDPFGGQEELEDIDPRQALDLIPQTPDVSYEDLFKQWQEEFPYQAPGAPDLVGPVQAEAAAARANLEDYLATTGQYSRNQAQAISDAYQQMSQQLLESSGDIFQRGQITASDIDQLYNTLATENLGTAYEGAYAGDVGGLAAPSGEAATGADVARTYGGSLADYLGQQAGIESAALEQTAGSQALQGAALAQSLRDYVAMAEAEKRYQLGRELSAAERDAAQQQAMLNFQADQMALDYQRQLAQQIFGFRAQDRTNAQIREDERRNAAQQAANLWLYADPQTKQTLSRMVGGLTGQEGFNAFVDAVYKDPRIITAVGMGA